MGFCIASDGNFAQSYAQIAGMFESKTHIIKFHALSLCLVLAILISWKRWKNKEKILFKLFKLVMILKNALSKQKNIHKEKTDLCLDHSIT